MRDSHRLKEKYELSLDNRQIVSLTVAALVVMAGVFSIGVVVGKKLATEGLAQAQPSSDMLQAVDQKTAALDAATLTFQESLTKKEAPRAEAPAAEAPKPVESPTPAQAAKPLDPGSAVPPAVAVAPSQAIDAPALPDAPRAQPIATRTNDAGALREAFGRAQASPEAVAASEWAVQLSASQERGEADRFAAGLRDKGYAPYIVEATVPGKGVWYRVRLGRFPSKDAATRYLSDFKRETSMSGIVAAN